jgi:hypothetical protein
MNNPIQPSTRTRSAIPRFFDWLFSWRIVRRLLIVLAWTVTIVALLYGEENWRGRHAWNKYRRELEAGGAQFDLKALIPKTVPDEQNFAATPFVESWFSIRAPEKVWNDNYVPASTRVLASTVHEGNRQFISLAAWEMAFESVQSGQPKPDQAFKSDKLDAESRAKAAPAVLDGLKASEAHLRELRAASRRSFSRYPVDYNLDDPWAILLPHLANVKAAVLRLQLEACAELAAGRSNSALEDVKLMFYMADSVKGEPCLISSLVRIACLDIAVQPVWEGLAEHRWSDAQLQELQTRLEQYDFVVDMKPSLNAERAAGVLTAELVREKGLGYLIALAGSDTPGPTGRRMANLLGWLIPSGWYYQEEVNYCRLFQLQMEGAFDTTQKRVFPNQVKSNVGELERELTSLRWGIRFLRHRQIAALLLPTLHRIPVKAATGQVVADQAALGCALERYRLANGQFPEKLDALAPRFIAQLPHDPITGEPYKYRRADDGRFVLYSVGWNEKDDGGVPGKVLFDDKLGDVVWQYPTK